MTGTIQPASNQTLKNWEKDCVHLSFVNDSGAALVVGQEVTLKTTGKVDKRNAGTDVPIGMVWIGGADQERVTVRLNCNLTMKAKAIGGTLNAGTFVVPNGNIDSTYETPEVIAAAEGDYVTMIVIKGGLANAQIILGWLKSPFLLNSLGGS
jgi:hypothetical protein